MLKYYNFFLSTGDKNNLTATLSCKALVACRYDGGGVRACKFLMHVHDITYALQAGMGGGDNPLPCSVASLPRRPTPT